jgi:hypothetical protein
MAPPQADNALREDPLTANSYAYVNGDPINLVDPNGHNPCSYEGTGPGGCTAEQNRALAASDRGADISGPPTLKRTYSSPAGDGTKGPAGCPAGYDVPRRSLGGLSTCQAIQTVINVYSECVQKNDSKLLQTCLTLLSFASQKIGSFNPIDCIAQHDNNLYAACQAEASKPKPSVVQIAWFGALNTLFGLLQGIGGFADEAVLPTAEIGAAGVRTAVSKGELPADILGTFANGAAGKIELQRDLIVFRFSGGVSGRTGRFLTDASTVNSIGGYGQSVIDALALPAGATAERLNAFIVPKGTTVYVGGVEGGASYAQQIFLNDPDVLVPLGGGAG